MPTIADIREKYPQYNDMSDGDLAAALHRKYYSDMPREQFDAKIGFGGSETVANTEPQAPHPSVRPLANLGGDYDHARREAQDLMASGLEDLKTPTGGDLLGSAGATLKGLGKTALGGLGYVASPINGALRSIVGRPGEEVLGIPKEYSELAAGLALPIPKRIPLPSFAKAAEKAEVPSVQQLKEAYVAAKESPEVAAVKIKPEATARNANLTKVELDTDWLDSTMAPKTHYILDKLQNPPKGSFTTMSSVDSARRLLGRLAGKGDEEAAAAQIAKRKLDEWVANIGEGTPGPSPGMARFYHSGSGEGGGGRWVTPNAEYARNFRAGNTPNDVHYVDIPENSPYLKKSYEDAGTSQKAPYVSFEAPEDIAQNLRRLQESDVLAGNPRVAQSIMQEGRQNYSGAKLGEALDAKVAKAELQSSGTYSGLNQQNKIKQKVTEFLSSDDSRGLTTTQRAAAEAVVNGTTSEKVIRFVANLMGGGGGMGTLASGAAGHAVAGPAGILAPLAGFGLNRVGAALTRNKAAKLSELIRSETPLGKQMAGPAQDFEKAAQAAEVSPTARNLSRLTIASRNLSTNLKDAGISITPNDLMKSLFGQKKAAADDNE